MSKLILRSSNLKDQTTCLWSESHKRYNRTELSESSKVIVFFCSYDVNMAALTEFCAPNLAQHKISEYFLVYILRGDMSEIWVQCSARLEEGIN